MTTRLMKDSTALVQVDEIQREKLLVCLKERSTRPLPPVPCAAAQWSCWDVPPDPEQGGPSFLACHWRHSTTGGFSHRKHIHSQHMCDMLGYNHGHSNKMSHSYTMVVLAPCQILVPMMSKILRVALITSF